MTKKQDLCAFCGEPTCSFAGDPGLWPLTFAHPDGTGTYKVHHTKCVTDRLFRSPSEPPGHSVIGGYCADCGGAEMHTPTCGHARQADDLNHEVYTAMLRQAEPGGCQLQNAPVCASYPRCACGHDNRQAEPGVSHPLFCAPAPNPADEAVVDLVVARDGRIGTSVRDLFDRWKDRDTMCKHDDGECHEDDPCEGCPVYQKNREGKPR